MPVKAVEDFSYLVACGLVKKSDQLCWCMMMMVPAAHRWLLVWCVAGSVAAGGDFGPCSGNARL
jgi:hypothetical protein